ncbi:MAG: hypothetical protein FJ004_06460 [Chloroflexi bacterium]|nr:hypothetical protein [Chloroflexota bacterium]
MLEQESLALRMKPYIQPFERELALRELKALAGECANIDRSQNNSESYLVSSSASSAHNLADRLAYWESVSSPDMIWTKQLKREATTYLVRNGIRPSELLVQLPFDGDSFPIPNRRCLRYGPHDIHEYRGKFFPQLVRALLNCSDILPGAVVMDPMCGSGTTLVEANLAGYEAVGSDLNPLSVLITKTKCSILRIHPSHIIEEYEHLREVLMVSRQRAQEGQLPYLSVLPKSDQRYLTTWFASHVLVDLDCIATTIRSMPPSGIRDLFWLCLSDILRLVSWQKIDDLRVRREVKPDADIDVIAEYLAQLGKTVRHVVAFLLQEGNTGYENFEVMCADARDATKVFERRGRQIDAVITSPPYATALPYLDTDRLSLVYLGLLPREAHRMTDREMIGNREITSSSRARLWNEYLQSKQSLPREVGILIDAVNDAYENTNVGFRRKNLPALLGKYFSDMAKVLRGVNELVKDDGHIFFVVGDNHTMAHGKRINIETGKLTGLIGEAVGLKLIESIPMDMLTPRDIFKKNSVASESIIHFQAQHHA